MKKGSIKILFLGCVILPFLGLSQEKLSLENAIQIGLKNNYQIQIAGKNLDITKKNNNWLEAGALPTISVKGSYGLNWSDNNNPASFIQGTSTSNSLVYGADLNWVLFNGFKVKITKDKLQQLEQQSEGNIAVAVENTIQAIVLGYYNALLQNEKLKALQQVIETSDAQYKKMQQKKDLGSISSFDLLQTENALLADSTKYLMQELSYKNALRNLNMLMAIDVEKEYVLTDKLNLKPNEFILNDLKEKMLSNNQTLKNQYINQEIMRKETGLMRTNLFPVLSFSSGITNNISGFEGTRAGGEQIKTSGNQSLNSYATLSLNFTLFNGHKTHRAFQNMKIKEEVAQLTTEEMQQNLTNKLITAYELYLARKTIAEMTKKSLETASLSLKIGEEKYATGSISSFEFRDIQTAYLNTAATEVESIYNVIGAYLELSRLTGGIIDDFEKK